MALQMNVPSVGGLTAQNAYVVVSSITVVKDGSWKLLIGCRVWKDQATRNNTNGVPIPSTVIDRFETNYNLVGSNVIAQAYVYIKSLPIFAGAVDV